MTDQALAATDDLAIEVPAELSQADSLHALAAPVRPYPFVMALLMLGSLTVHGVIVATAIVASDAALVAAPTEIPVEIVSEPPAAKPAPAKPTPAKTVAPPPPAKVSPANDPAASKPEAARQAINEPPKPATPPVPPTPPKPAATPTAEHQDIDALQKELAALKAEQAALHAHNAEPALDRSAEGPLAGSLRAVAMPGTSQDGDDVVAYQTLVFSQLAKAKGLGEYEGAGGTTGVRFAVDEAGRLVSVEVAASSGNAQLDAEALAIVRRASPFPLPPKDAERTFVANVNFVPPKPK